MAGHSRPRSELPSPARAFPQAWLLCTKATSLLQRERLRFSRWAIHDLPPKREKPSLEGAVPPNETMEKVALITGITGQDGSYLAELLLSKGYEVHGLIRRASSFNTSRLSHIYADPHDPQSALRLHYGDMSDASALARLLSKIEPCEIYNLAAQSHV